MQVYPVSIQLAIQFENWLGIALAVVAAALEIWAVIDCLTRKPDAFIVIGDRPKSFWLALTGIAAVVGVLTALSSLVGGRFGFFGIIALCISAVYLAGPRRQLQAGTNTGWGH